MQRHILIILLLSGLSRPLYAGDALPATQTNAASETSTTHSASPGTVEGTEENKDSSKKPATSMVLIEFEGFKVSVTSSCLSAIYENDESSLNNKCGPSARFAAALYYIGEHDIDIADKTKVDHPLKMMEAAAKEGYVPAIYYTGIIYYAAKNYNDAYPFLEEAATHGVKEAMSLVGIINLLDDLKEPDHVKGLAWLIIASLNGDEMALKYMKLLDEHTSPGVTQSAFEEAKILMDKIKYNALMQSNNGCVKI